MPLIDQDILLNNTVKQNTQPNEPASPDDEQSPDQGESPSWLQGVKSNFMLNTTTGAALHALSTPWPSLMTQEPNYSPFDNGSQELKGYENYANKFVGSPSPEATKAIKADIDYENGQRQLLGNLSTAKDLTSNLVAQGLDPINYVPILGAVKAVGLGARIAGNAAVGAISGGVTGLAQQEALASLQKTKTQSEVLQNAVSYAAFGGVFGGVLGGLSKEAVAGASIAYRDTLRGQPPKVDLSNGVAEAKVVRGEGMAVEAPKLLPETVKPNLPPEEGVINATPFDPEGGGSGGAAEVTPESMYDAHQAKAESEGLAWMNDTFTKDFSSFGFRSMETPTIRGLADSPFASTRSFTNAMFQHNYILGKNLLGIPTEHVAENAMTKDSLGLIKDLNGFKQTYVDYAGGKFNSAMAGIGMNDKVPYRDFSSRIAHQIRTGKWDDDIAGVNDVGQAMVKNMQSRWKEITDRGLDKGEGIGEDGKPISMVSREQAANYLTRRYNTEKLSDPQEAQAFRDMLVRNYMSHDKEGLPRTGVAYKDLGEGKLQQTGSEPIPRNYAEQEAMDTFHNIMGMGDQSLALNNFTKAISSGTKVLKDRTLNLPDTELEPWLHNDSMSLYKDYMNKTSAMIRAHDAMQQLGAGDLTGVKKQIRDDYDIKAAKPGLSQKEGIKLKQKYDSDIAFVDEAYRTLTNTVNLNKTGRQFFSALHSFNFVRLLGGVSFSVLNHFAIVPMQYGYFNTLRDGFLPLLHSFQDLKVSAHTWKDFDIALQAHHSSLLDTLTTTAADSSNRTTTWERMLSATTGGFAKATGLHALYNTQRYLTHQVASASIIRALKKLEPLSDAERLTSTMNVADLAKLGIGKEHYNDMLQQINSHAEPAGGSWFSNVHTWDNLETKDRFVQAVMNSVDSAILRPGKGDIPLFFRNSNIGRTIGQFKTFFMALTNRAVMTGLQRRDMRAGIGFVGLATMALMNQYVRSKIYGQVFPTDPLGLAQMAITHSGLAGFLGTQSTEMAGSIINPSYRGQAADTATGMVGGPSIGLLQKAAGLAQAYVDKGATDKNIRDTIQLAPFHGLPYLQGILQSMFPKPTPKHHSTHKVKRGNIS